VANTRRFELEDILIRPGTYFNPQTEIMVVIDDSPEVDRELFEDQEISENDWVLISDETPIDEAQRDDLVERFQVSHQPGSSAGSDEDEQDEDEQDELDPDEEEPEEE
jgi:hypothetical protein